MRNSKWASGHFQFKTSFTNNKKTSSTIVDFWRRLSHMMRRAHKRTHFGRKSRGNSTRNFSRLVASFIFPFGMLNTSHMKSSKTIGLCTFPYIPKTFAYYMRCLHSFRIAGWFCCACFRFDKKTHRQKENRKLGEPNWMSSVTRVEIV